MYAIRSYYAGSTVNMQSRLKNTPFAITRPKSTPIVNDINTNASIPTIVVIELLEMAVNELCKA